MEDKIWNKLVASDRILLVCHPRPDSDSLASNLSLKIILEKLGKRASLISGDDPKPPNLKFLPGFNSILDQEFSSVDLTQYDLLVCLDISSPNRVSSKESPQFPLPIPTAVIDHHKDNTKFGELNLVVTNTTSTSEVIWELVEKNAEKLIDKDFATCIYTGIWGDTAGFTSSSISSRTLQIVGKCVDAGVRLDEITGILLSSPVSSVNLMGAALAEAKLYFSGKVLEAKVPYSMFEKFGIKSGDIGAIKETTLYQLQRAQEPLITVMNYEFEPGLVSVSLRSYNSVKVYDISQIASSLGGGGHKQAASFKFKGNVNQAEKELFRVITEVYPELGEP